MGFDLALWLKSQVGNNALEIPLLDISNRQADDPREWLVTNGLGSYASFNIWGANTRRYHGLLIAALEPPVRRTLLLSRMDETVDGEEIATNFWASGAINPKGYQKLVAFTVYPVPTWAYKLANGYLIKQLTMVPGKQEVVIGYSWIGAKSVTIRLDLLFNYRDFHSETRGSQNWQFQQLVESDRVTIKAFDSAQPLTVSFTQAAYQESPLWYWQYYWPRERERGLCDHEDNFRAGTITAVLEADKPLTIRAGLDSTSATGNIADTVRAQAAYQQALIRQAGDPNNVEVKRLIVACDQFIVRRQSTDSHSIIAGYHWFADWGRDSMISLPGLTLSTGRHNEAKSILSTFGQYLSQGMLPNNFPDSGSSPEYNTADATFWWGWSLRKYLAATKDLAFIKEQLPLLLDVIQWHENGTRYGLHIDSDGLITGGSCDVQLTWMDAKVGNFVVTPRTGKAVEINALWINFLDTVAFLLDTTGGDKRKVLDLAAKAKSGFQKFWNAESGCLFDVIRDNGTTDSSIRCNQILAVSLPVDLLPKQQAQSVLTAVERDLLTAVGLRTLSAADPNYRGAYGDGKNIANQYDRDCTYHQGTVWPWLFGAWVDARLKMFGKTQGNLDFIKSKLFQIRAHLLTQAGVGSVSEIFDGNDPNLPRGCIAQAWSVAELLRILSEHPELQ